MWRAWLGALVVAGLLGADAGAEPTRPGNGPEQLAQGRRPGFYGFPRWDSNSGGYDRTRRIADDARPAEQKPDIKKPFGKGFGPPFMRGPGGFGGPGKAKDPPKKAEPTAEKKWPGWGPRWMKYADDRKGPPTKPSAKPAPKKGDWAQWRGGKGKDQRWRGGPPPWARSAFGRSPWAGHHGPSFHGRSAWGAGAAAWSRHHHGHGFHGKSFGRGGHHGRFGHGGPPWRVIMVQPPAARALVAAATMLASVMAVPRGHALTPTVTTAIMLRPGVAPALDVAPPWVQQRSRYGAQSRPASWQRGGSQRGYPPSFRYGSSPWSGRSWQPAGPSRGWGGYPGNRWSPPSRHGRDW